MCRKQRHYSNATKQWFIPTQQFFRNHVLQSYDYLQASGLCRPRPKAIAFSIDSVSSADRKDNYNLPPEADLKEQTCIREGAGKDYI